MKKPIPRRTLYLRVLIDLQEETAFNPRLLFEMAYEGDEGGHIGKTVERLIEADIHFFVGTLEVAPEHANILIALNNPALLRNLVRTIGGSYVWFCPI